MNVTPAVAAVVAAVFGLSWGSFVGVLVDRVAGGGPGVAPSRTRARGARAAIAFASGLAFGVAALRWQRPLVALLVGLFLSISVGLALIDLEHRRLPNAIVVPSIAVALGLIALGSATGEGPSVAGALVGAASLGGFLWAVSVLSRGGIGLGDAKYGILIGLVVGSLDLGSVAVAAGAAVLAGGATAAVVLVAGGDRRSAIPFGPMLAFGALVGLFAGPMLASGPLGR